MKEASLRPYLSKLSQSSSQEERSSIIQEILNDPGIYVFGELLDIPGIDSLPIFPLLQTFAFGIVKDLSENVFASLPEIQKKKIRQLTIVTLSNSRRVLPYTLLLEELSLPNVRELEDLIIDAMYVGVLKGKMDQKSKALLVDEKIGRDISGDEELERMFETLSEWRLRAAKVIETTETQTKIAQKQRERDMDQAKQIIQKIQEVQSLAAANALAAADGDDFGSDPRKRKAKDKR